MITREIKIKLELELDEQTAKWLYDCANEQPVVKHPGISKLQGELLQIGGLLGIERGEVE